MGFGLRIDRKGTVSIFHEEFERWTSTTHGPLPNGLRTTEQEQTLIMRGNAMFLVHFGRGCSRLYSSLGEIERVEMVTCGFSRSYRNFFFVNSNACLYISDIKRTGALLNPDAKC